MAKKLLKYAPTESQTEAPTEAPPESPTEALTEAPTEALTEALTEAQTEALTESQTEALTEAQTEALTESQTESQTEAQTFNQPICSSVTCSTFGNPSGFTIGLTISGSITVLKSNLFTHFSAASLSSRSLFIWSILNAFVSGLNSYLLHLSSLRLKCAQMCE
jgi:hypothetical protein